MTNPKVTRWPYDEPPAEAALLRLYEREGLQPYEWSNAPGDTYDAHVHTYAKMLIVVSGSITFGLPDSGEQITLYAGDRLDLPAGVRHDAVVGPEGVVCLEGHRS